jgi:hypothetical protein
VQERRHTRVNGHAAHTHNPTTSTTAHLCGQARGLAVQQQRLARGQPHRLLLGQLHRCGQAAAGLHQLLRLALEHGRLPRGHVQRLAQRQAQRCRERRQALHEPLQRHLREPRVLRHERAHVV